jgi:hypothetical protein
MLISRRSTLAYASVATACATHALPAYAKVSVSGQLRTAQLVQHLVIHQDQTAGRAYHAALAVLSPDTAWQAPGLQSERDYQLSLATYARRGYGLRRVDAFQTKRGLRYAAIWQWGAAAPARIQHDMTAAGFKAATEFHAAENLVLAHVGAHTTPAGARFTALWDKAFGPAQKVFAGLTAAHYKQTVAALAADGFRPQQIAGYAVDGGVRFAAVFTNRASAFEAHHAIPAMQFHARSAALLAQGYALRDASGFIAGGRPFIAAVWEQA